MKSFLILATTYHQTAYLASYLSHIFFITSFLFSPHPPEEPQDSLSLTTNISPPFHTTCSLSHSQHRHLHVNILKKDETVHRFYSLKVQTWLSKWHLWMYLTFLYLPPRYLPAASGLSPRDGRGCNDIRRSLFPSPHHDRRGAPGATGRVVQGQEGDWGLKKSWFRESKSIVWPDRANNGEGFKLFFNFYNMYTVHHFDCCFWVWHCSCGMNALRLF